MKKILLLSALILMSQTVVFAQKDKPVKESDVPVRYVKDFQNQAKEAQNVSWVMSEDSAAYMATFTSPDGDKQAIRFTNKTSETRYYIDEQYYPHAIKDTLTNQFPKHKISEIYIRNIKGKMTYQVRIYRKAGFLFWKKETDVKTVAFETNSKLIEVIDEQ
ncbi:MAG: hypothetical protein MJZ77_08405 [Bacteroidales bacterium]|nr:hypothetical protein [Bacteroidales bacterium]